MFINRITILQLISLADINVIILPIAIAIGAVFGALSRYYINLLGSKYINILFPSGILLINITGAFLVGFIGNGILDDVAIEFKKFLVVGFLGSYTTFSSYILDLEFRLNLTLKAETVA